MRVIGVVVCVLGLVLMGLPGAAQQECGEGCAYTVVEELTRPPTDTEVVGASNITVDGHGQVFTGSPFAVHGIQPGEDPVKLPTSHYVDLAGHPDGGFIAIGDRRPIRFDAAGNELFSYDVLSQPAPAVGPDGTVFLSFSGLLRVFPPSSQGQGGVDYPGVDGRLIGATSSSLVWRVARELVVTDHDATGARAVRSLAQTEYRFAVAGEQIVVLRQDGLLTVLDLDGQVVATVEPPPDSFGSQAVVGAFGETVVVAGRDAVWRLNRQTMEWDTLAGPVARDVVAHVSVVSADGNIPVIDASGGARRFDPGGIVYVLSWRTMDGEYYRLGSNDVVTRLDVNGNVLSTISDDAEITDWDLAGGLVYLNGPSGLRAFTPDGTHVRTIASADTQVTVAGDHAWFTSWDRGATQVELETGTEVANLLSVRTNFGIEVDPHRQVIYLVNYVEDRVDVYRFDGRFVISLPMGQVVAMPDGTVLHDDDGARVLRLRLTDEVLDRDHPVGGPGGALVTDASDAGRVTSVTVSHGAWIDAIQVTTSDQTFPRRGGPSGRQDVVDATADDAIVEVWGGHDGIRILWIAFRTARGVVSGPFGTARPGEEQFRFTAPQGQGLRGLRMRYDSAVRGVGAIFGPMELPQPRPVVGGPGGTAFVDEVTGPDQLTGLTVRHGAWIDAVQLHTEAGDLPRRGGLGGQSTTVPLGVGDAIVEVFGTTDGEYVTALGVRTATGRTYGPYGGGHGEGFSLAAPAGEVIVGLHGRSGGFLDAIGIITAAGQPGDAIDPPVGGPGGRPFFDDSASPITGMSVRSGAWIDAVQLLTDDGSTQSHGGSGGHETVFVLDDGETITSVFGWHDGTYVRRLGFRTSLGRTSGPLGSGGSEHFELAVPDGHVLTGLHGRSGGYLDAIGIITAPTG